jgi:hypothetical protein
MVRFFITSGAQQTKSGALSKLLAAAYSATSTGLLSLRSARRSQL